MKKSIFLLVLLMVSLTACCQTDQTFTKPIYANGGIYFLDGTFLNTALSGGAVEWNSILNKPLTFPPATHDHNLLYKPIGYVPTWVELTGKPSTYPPSIHNHDALYRPITYVTTWDEIPDKPGDIELIDALSRLGYTPLVQKTTAEINATVIPVGTVAMIWDKTLGVMKIWNGSIWKVYIAAQ